MYYLICTILIMLFCITALTLKNSPESAIFLPGPKPPLPQACRTEASHIIKRNNQLQFAISIPLAEEKDLITCIKQIKPPGFNGHYWMYVAANDLKQFSNCHGLSTGDAQQAGSLVFHATQIRKSTSSEVYKNLITPVQVNQSDLPGPISSSVYLLTLIMPATSFFSINSKKEIVRRIAASTNEPYSLRQLRYFTLQAPIYNGPAYRKVLKLKYQKENSQL